MWTWRRLLVAASVAVTGCAFGEISGPPLSLISVKGDPLTIADCTALAMQREHKKAKCDPNDIELDLFERSNQAIISCSLPDGGSVFTQTKSLTLYTLAFSEGDEGGTKVEVWAAPTFPGVKTYSAVVQEFIDSCAAS